MIPDPNSRLFARLRQPELRLGLSLGLPGGGGNNVPALDLSFVNNETLDSRITFTRGSSGTRVNSSGVIETISSGNPRFDYSPSAIGTALGLLIEEQRTNLALWSRDLTNAAWTKSNTTAALTATGPDGVANSASTLTATASNGTALQSITSASATRITSAWIKRRTGSGTINMTQDNGTTWTAVTVAANWTRVNIPSATVTNPIIGFRIVTNGDAVDIALVQQEVGAFITSAIPTTSAQVTRSADVASIRSTAFSGWFNATVGTFVAEFDIPVVNAGSSKVPFSANNAGGSSNSWIRFFVTTAGVCTGNVRDTGVDQTGINAGTMTAAATTKLALAYAVNNFAASLNGAAAVADTLGTVPTGLDRLTIGGDEAQNLSLNGHVRRISYWMARLPDSTLQGPSQ